MSEEKLPKGWKLKPLKDLNSRKSKNLDPSKFPDTTFELWSVPQFEYSEPEYLKGREIMSTKQKVDLGDVLISKINPRINRVWVVQNFSDYEKIASSEWIIIKPKDFIDSRYIKYVTTAPFFRSLLQSEVSGVGGSLTRARPKIVENYKIPVAPLPEQQRIVAKLDAIFGHLDELREKLDRIPLLLKNFRQQVLTQAVTGELTKDHSLSEEAYFKFYKDVEYQRRRLWEKVEEETIIKKGGIPKKDWEIRYKIPNRSDRKCLVEFPNKWEQKSLEYWAEVIDPNPRHRNPKYVENGIPFLSTAQFGDLDGWDFKNINYVTEETVIEQEDRCRFNKGSIVFSRKGTIGKTRLVPNDTRFALLDSLCVINPNPLIDSDFLNICLRSEPIQKQVTELTRGVALKQVSLGAVRSLLIPVPPVQVQEKIVSRVNSITSLADKIESRYKSLKAKIDQMPQAILAKAFRGELVGQEVKEYVREAGEVMMAAEAKVDYLETTIKPNS